MVELCPDYRQAETLRGLSDFDYLWLIWGFSANIAAKKRSTVRPPRLGGNQHVGVFSTRSPFRPNNLGLSSVRIINVGDGRIEVAGADLMDGTPVYDIKPYIAFTDSHPEALGGFVDAHRWHTLEVHIPDDIATRLPQADITTLRHLLSQDPRPQYHNDPGRIYGMPFNHRDIHFKVENGTVKVVAITDL